MTALGVLQEQGRACSVEYFQTNGPFLDEASRSVQMEENGRPNFVLHEACFDIHIGILATFSVT